MTPEEQQKRREEFAAKAGNNSENFDAWQILRVWDWCDKNPLRMWGDYRDEIPREVVEKLIDDNDLEAFDSWLWECEINHSDYMLSEYIDEATKELAEEFGISEDSEEIEDEHESARDELRELISESYSTDSSDFMKTCLRNTKPQVAAMPLDENGDLYEFPNGYDCDREENARRIRALRKIGVANPWKAETCYSYDSLTIIGTIDLESHIENLAHGRKPVSIGIGHGYAMTHNSFNGSGGLGDVVIRGNRALPFTLRYDETRKYGVQSVFGFVGSVWKEELDINYAEA